MTNREQAMIGQPVFVNVLARTKIETAALVDAVFPESGENIRGLRGYHVITCGKPGREAVESEDDPRMHTLKRDRLNSGSCMETDSLPEYDDLYPDGGDGDRRQGDGGRRLESSRDLDAHLQMENLKSAHELHVVSNETQSSTLPSTSSSYAETTTSSHDVVRMKEGLVRQKYHVYEVPWEADRGLLWATMPISLVLFVLVIDVDATMAEIIDDYIDMLRSIDDLCTNKNVFEETENPTLYLVGKTKKEGKDGRNVFQKTMRTLRSDLMQHTQMCHIFDKEFLLMPGSPELLQDLRHSLNNFVPKTIGQNIPLVQKICEITSACQRCVVSLPEIMQNMDCGDPATVISKLNYLQTVGVLVYMEMSQHVWTRPALLTEACGELQNLDSENLTENTMVKFFREKLKLSKPEASACLTALQCVGILVQISDAAFTNHSHSLNSNQNQYFFSLHLKHGTDYFLRIDPSLKYTPVLRFSLRERKPQFLMCNMIAKLRQKNWQPVQQGTKVLLNQQSAVFKFCGKAKPKSARIYLSTDRKNIYVTVVSFDGAELDTAECAKVREDVESAILASVFHDSEKLVANGSTHLVNCEIRCRDTTGVLNGADGWHEVDSLTAMLKDNDIGVCDQHPNCDTPHKIKPSTLLNSWFPVETKNLSSSRGSSDLNSMMDCDTFSEKVDSVNKPLKDGLLSKLSKCIGSGWEMFFVENGLDQSDVDMAKADNPGQMTKQVYACLRYWRDGQRDKRPFAKLLREKLRKCDHLTINMDKFDDIVSDD